MFYYLNLWHLTGSDGGWFPSLAKNDLKLVNRPLCPEMQSHCRGKKRSLPVRPDFNQMPKNKAVKKS